MGREGRKRKVLRKRKETRQKPVSNEWEKGTGKGWKEIREASVSYLPLTGLDGNNRDAVSNATQVGPNGNPNITAYPPIRRKIIWNREKRNGKGENECCEAGRQRDGIERRERGESSHSGLFFFSISFLPSPLLHLTTLFFLLSLFSNPLLLPLIFTDLFPAVAHNPIWAGAGRGWIQISKIKLTMDPPSLVKSPILSIPPLRAPLSNK
jgi:hypothetical protein